MKMRRLNPPKKRRMTKRHPSPLKTRPLRLKRNHQQRKQRSLNRLKRNHQQRKQRNRQQRNHLQNPRPTSPRSISLLRKKQNLNASTWKTHAFANRWLVPLKSLKRWKSNPCPPWLKTTSSFLHTSLQISCVLAVNWTGNIWSVQRLEVEPCFLLNNLG